jgi:glycosyltransferase involved in cell wall biosynthesis
MMPQVSVIVPAYNVEKYIDQCISSILNQTYVNTEIIVVYDKSPDNTRRLLDKYAQGIHLIEHQEKTNTSIAKNAALRIARGSYVAFCDADDVWVPAKLEEQVAFLERHPQIGLCYTNIIVIDDSGNIIGKKEAPLWNREKLMRLPLLILSSVMVRRTLLNEIGYFDERLSTYEDFDIYRRLCRVTSFARLNSFLTYRRHRQSQLTRDEYQMVKGKSRVYLKHGMYTTFAKAMLEMLLWRIVQSSPSVYFRLLQTMERVLITASSEK